MSTTPTVTSRLLSMLIVMAKTLAANETQEVLPHVTAAFNEVPADIRADNPVQAFLQTALNAWKAILADPKVVPSFTGLLAATGLVTSGNA